MKIIPVIHHLDHETTMRNAKICYESNVFGVFLIEMNGENTDLGILGMQIKKMYPKLKVGLNLLGETALTTVNESIKYDLDMSWSDNPIVTSNEISKEAEKIKDLIKKEKHMFFNSVAFKYQKLENSPGIAARNSISMGFIPTTSGSATGVAVNIDKLEQIKFEIGFDPLAIASGLDLNNISEHKKYIEYGLVSTGISKDFYNFDENKVKEIVLIANE